MGSSSLQGNSRRTNNFPSSKSALPPGNLSCALHEKMATSNAEISAVQRPPGKIEPPAKHLRPTFETDQAIARFKPAFPGIALPLLALSAGRLILAAGRSNKSNLLIDPFSPTDQFQNLQQSLTMEAKTKEESPASLVKWKCSGCRPSCRPKRLLPRQERSSCW